MFLHAMKIIIMLFVVKIEHTSGRDGNWKLTRAVIAGNAFARVQFHAALILFYPYSTARAMGGFIYQREKLNFL